MICVTVSFNISILLIWPYNYVHFGILWSVPCLINKKHDLNYSNKWHDPGNETHLGHLAKSNPNPVKHYPHLFLSFICIVSGDDLGVLWDVFGDLDWWISFQKHVNERTMILVFGHQSEMSLNLKAWKWKISNIIYIGVTLDFSGCLAWISRLVISKLLLLCYLLVVDGLLWASQPNFLRDKLANIEIHLCFNFWF